MYLVVPRQRIMRIEDGSYDRGIELGAVFELASALGIRIVIE